MPDNKVAICEVYFDETIKQIQTKKGITGENGAIRKGCTMIPQRGNLRAAHVYDKGTFFQKQDLSYIGEGASNTASQDMGRSIEAPEAFLPRQGRTIQ